MDSLVLFGCRGPHESEATVIGSGIAIEDSLVLTAKHLDCPDGQQVVLKEGAEWIEIPDSSNYAHGTYDARMIVDGRKHPSLTFRDGVVGEATTGFGAAFGSDGFLTFGWVMRIEDWRSYFSNPPIGGLSGSAVYGDDGSVIGMVVVSVRDEGHGTAVTGAISGSTLGELIQRFKDAVQYEGPH